MQDNTFHLLTLNNTPIYEQLQIEEALLRTDDKNYIIVNHGSTPAIVMGVSGKLERLVNLEKMRQNPVPVIKRFSGGGTVFVDENTFFLTFICNSEKVKVPCFPCHVHCFIEKIYTQVFDKTPFSLKENDYVMGEKKFGGNAQYLKKGRFLHHTTLLWDYKNENMDYLLMPEKTPQYRKQRGHSEFLCKLSDFYPTLDDLLQRFYTSFEKQFELRNVLLDEIKSKLEAPHRKAATLIDLQF